MTPDEVIKLLLDILAEQRELLKQLAASAQRDPGRDIKLFFLGLMSALVAGYFSHWLEMRQEEEKRKLEEWERLKDWDRDGRQEHLRGTNLTPPWLWLRLRLPPRLACRLPRPRYLDLEEVILGVYEEHEARHEARADLRRAKLPCANLVGANLRRAYLEGADLRGAILWEANLQAAILLEADLQGADLMVADLQGADLRGARHLDSVDFDGALANSKTRWPSGFQVPETVLMVED